MNLPNSVKYKYNMKLKKFKEHDKITDNFAKYLHEYHNQSVT